LTVFATGRADNFKPKGDKNCPLTIKQVDKFTQSEKIAISF